MAHKATGGQSLPGALLVPIERVERDPHQPRRDWRHDDGGARLSELTQSVREFGILQPLVVRRDGERFIVIAGGRRLVAARRAGLSEVPVVVRADTAARVRVMQLVENVVRQDLAPLDEARAYQELLDLDGVKPPAISRRVHVSAQHIRDRLRLLRDQILADAVERRQIAASVAREINKLPDDVADDLRRQVQDGARLQMSAILELRARLAAQGVTNPRRKARPAAVLDVQSGLEPAGKTPAAGHLPADAEDTALSTTMEAPSRPLETPPAPRTVAMIAVPAPVTAHADKIAEGPIGAEQSRGDDQALSAPLNRAEARDRGDQTFAALVAAVDWPTVESLLLYGVEHGWTCAGLLQQARCLEQ